MVRHNYGACLMIAFGGLLCHFALCAENNDSRIMYFPRSEYIRVISNIINPPPEESNADSLPQDVDDVDPGEEDDGTSHRVTFLQDVATETNVPAPRRRIINPRKRDSFFFLQRSLERRIGRVSTVNSKSTA
jgi:hypothetical protein